MKEEQGDPARFHCLLTVFLGTEFLVNETVRVASPSKFSVQANSSWSSSLNFPGCRASATGWKWSVSDPIMFQSLFSWSRASASVL